MEILFDIFLELHSILRTRLPDPWTFIKLKHNEELTIIINNITYFIAYFAFLAWFVEVFISRVQDTCGKRLDVKDKWFAAVLSLVCAVHLLWPFLLFFTHFLTCCFYPWTTSIVVLLLYIYFMTTSFRIIHFYTSSKIFLLKHHLQRIFSFENLIMSRTLQSTAETFRVGYTTAYTFFEDGRISFTGEDDFRPSATPVIQPRLEVEKEYRPSEALVTQPIIAPDEQYESHRPSKAPVIQPRIAPDEEPESYKPFTTLVTKPKIALNEIQEFYRPSEAPEKQPRIAHDEQHESYRPSEAPVIQPRLEPHEHRESYRLMDKYNVQFRTLPEKQYGPSETPVIQPRPDHRGLQTEYETQEIQPTEKTGHHEEFWMASGVGASEGGAGYSINSEKPLTFPETRDKYVETVTEFRTRESQTDDRIKYKDFSQQVDLSKRRIRTSIPRNQLVKDSKKGRIRSVRQCWDLKRSYKMGYCGRCWKVDNLPFRPEFTTLREPRTTRLGTSYGPPRYFLPLHQFIAEYGIGLTKWISRTCGFT
ncbi:hypothetical protein HNY73_004173 [Argiope bruennichi]|uniref:Uncharacterized protein n=1 Tax=Argiope bruennichi TaxID=94029 RepID=A0A8T0FSD9_ARGBR|nr:hypothetical protein HNY73_004173 [Argiope bruennichi]